MGSRAAVVMLHGQPGSSRDWFAVLDALGDRVLAVAPDRPGWDRRTPATDLRGNAAAAVAAMDRLGIDRAIVAGHSLGAAIAAFTAIEHPERVSALVLASPAANLASIEPFDHVLAAPLAGPLLSAAVMAGVGLALSVAPPRELVASRLAIDPSYLAAAARELLLPAAWRAFVTEQRALIAQIPELEARLPEIRAPAVVVAGSADRVVPLAAARELAEQITGARLIVVEGADHLLPQRHGARVAEAILSEVASG